MSRPGDENVVHQIVYQWSQRSLTGHRGVGPVATSLPGDAVELWDQRLREKVWANAASDGELAFLGFGSERAIVHRVSVTDASGREGSTLAHVLIGVDMSAWVAAGLHDWDGWIASTAAAERATGADGLPGLGFDLIKQVADGGFQRLRLAIRERSPGLVADLVTQVLSDPAAALSVLDSPITPAELVCALVDILGESGTMPLTFSTAEQSDAGSELPRLVFMADSGGFSTRAAKRRRLQLNADRVEPASLAALLTDLYLRAGSEAIMRLRENTPLSTVDDVERLAKRAQLVPGVLADAADLLTRIGSGQLSSAEYALLTSDEVRRLEPLLRACTPAELTDVIDDWTCHPDAWARHPAVCELVRTEAMARGTDDVGIAVGAPSDTPLAPDRAYVKLRALPEIREGTLPIERLSWLLDTAVRAGVDRSGQVSLVHNGGSGLRSDILLRWVARNAATSPLAAEVVLNAVGKRGHDRRQRRRNRAVIVEYGGFTDVVERICPQEQRTAVDLFEVLVDMALGPDVNRKRTLRPVLDSLTAYPHAALLYVLYRRITVPRLQRAVLELASEQFFAQQGFTGYRGRSSP